MLGRIEQQTFERQVCISFDLFGQLHCLACRLNTGPFAPGIAFNQHGNMRKWAMWGAVAVCAINLVIFFFTPQAFSAMMIKSEAIIWSVLLSSVTLLCNGPLGDLLVILAAPTLLKATKNNS